MLHETLNQLIGVWKLVDMYFLDETKSIVHKPMGDNPSGVLIYTENKYMSAQLGNLDRHKFLNNDYRFGTNSEIFEAFNQYIAYTGKYDVNINKEYILHKIQMSMFPNWIGQNVKRYYNFENVNDKLYLYLSASEIDFKLELLESNVENSLINIIKVTPVIKWVKV